MPVMRKNRVDRCAWRIQRKSFEKGNQAPLVEFILNHPDRYHCNTKAIDCRVAQKDKTVGIHPPRNRDVEFAVGFPEFPLGAAGLNPERNAFMFGQLARVHGATAGCKILRARAQYRPAYKDLARDETGIGEVTDTYGQIDAAMNQVHDIGRHRKPHLHIGITFQEVGKNGRKIGDREIRLDRDVQAARGGVGELPHSQLRFFDIRNNASRVSKIDLPRLREALRSGRPVEEPRTQFAFEGRDLT